jgi:hypothetical protein
VKFVLGGFQLFFEIMEEEGAPAEKGEETGEDKGDEYRKIMNYPLVKVFSFCWKLDR